MVFVKLLARRSISLLMVFAGGICAVSAAASEATGPQKRPVASKPCVEEARLTAVNDSMSQLLSGNAADPKIYEAKDPVAKDVLFNGHRSGTYTYEFLLQVFDDYKGGMWPAYEQYEVAVTHDPSANQKSETCKIRKLKLIQVYY